jgi:hypothetical protein
MNGWRRIIIRSCRQWNEVQFDLVKSIYIYPEEYLPTIYQNLGFSEQIAQSTLPSLGA